MKVNLTTPESVLKAGLRKRADLFRQALKREAAICGEKLTNIARRTGAYLDQTGNLRSSIGYAVDENGSTSALGSFESVSGSKGDGSQGSAEGLRYARELVGVYRAPVTLIMAAGMSYAEYVEAKGLNVLAGSRSEADRVLKDSFKRLGLK